MGLEHLPLHFVLERNSTIWLCIHVSSQSKIKLLVVGVGSIGERHVRCFQATERAEVAICEPNASLRGEIDERYRVADSHGDLEQALREKGFDGVVLCTPAHLHVAMAAKALTAGASVLIEKPLGTSLAGTEDLLHLRDEKKLTVGIAYVLRLVPALRQARAYLRKNILGKPLHAAVVAGQHFPTYRPAYRDTYYTRHQSGGGAIQDALTHLVHNVEWLLGPTESLFCDASHQMLEGVEVEDTVNVAARNSGVPVSYALNQFQAPNESYLWIHCENGSIKVELRKNRWGFLLRRDDDWTWHHAPVKDRDEMFTTQATAFLDAMEGKENDLSSLEEGIQTLKFNLAALESARSGKRVIL